MLRAVSARLDGVIRDADALGRLGGDEFVVISEALTLQVGPELIAERLLDALDQPFKLTYPTHAAFEVFLKDIKLHSAGGTKLPAGIPIYVDPIGLSEARAEGKKVPKKAAKKRKAARRWKAKR